MTKPPQYPSSYNICNAFNAKPTVEFSTGRSLLQVNTTHPPDHHSFLITDCEFNNSTNTRKLWQTLMQLVLAHSLLNVHKLQYIKANILLQMFTSQNKGLEMNTTSKRNNCLALCRLLQYLLLNVYVRMQYLILNVYVRMQHLLLNVYVRTQYLLTNVNVRTQYLILNVYVRTQYLLTNVYARMQYLLLNVHVRLHYLLLNDTQC